MKRLLMTVLTLSTVLASANEYCEDDCCENYCEPSYCAPCMPSCCTPAGKIEIWGDALYFKPSSCNFDDVINDRVTDTMFSDNSFPYGEERGVCPKFHWGFRIGANYCFPCSDADVSLYYSRLKTSDRKAVFPLGREVLWTTAIVAKFTPSILFKDGNKTSAFIKVNQEWNAFDAEVGYSINNYGCFSMRGHIGLHWADIRVERLIGYKGNFASLSYNDPSYTGAYTSLSKTWGVGPRFGGDFRYDLGCGLGLVARASWGVLAGETQYRDEAQSVTKYSMIALDGPAASRVISDPGKFAIGNRTRCIVFPEFDTSLGVNYTVCLNCCFEASFEIGWEFRTYLQSVLHSYYQDRLNTANTATACDPFNLQGLYLRGLIRF